MFTEGWVEFKDKRIARAVARSLNGQILGISLQMVYMPLIVSFIVKNCV